MEGITRDYVGFCKGMKPKSGSGAAHNSTAERMRYTMKKTFKKYTVEDIKAIAYEYDNEIQRAVFIYDDEDLQYGSGHILFDYSTEDFESDQDVDDAFHNEYDETCYWYDEENDIYYGGICEEPENI